jgi:hypothetical protein
MGLWPIRRDEARLRSRNHLQRKVSLSFVIPSEAEGSAVSVIRATSA